MENILIVIEQIANDYGVFECVQCADAIQNFLISQGISGKRIKLDVGFRDLPWSIIYDLKRQEQIATNGIHEGIVVQVDEQEIVFDNIEHAGIDKAEWLCNLSSPTIELERGTFEITQEEF
ncbi:hypothetical protein CAL7716_090450 [Calothrix sp. PCC 7716]|nr:hypothetical protein CAL7716_090450 [Calothrix sp. PCC 7716]